MLEITNVRNGAVLSHANGTETDEFLEFQLEGLADSASFVTVDGVEAVRADRKFSGSVRLTRKQNEIVVASKSKYGEIQQKIIVIWDKKSFLRYNFYIDDNIFFLTDIAKSRPASLFDHFYLKFLRDMHRKYGVKMTLNLFYKNDHFPFELKDFPDRYKAEWRDNSDWLKLSFHAYSEFPDRPYQHAAPEKLAADYDLLKGEIIRFAGEESFIPPPVIHWAMVPPDNFSVLKERGVRYLSGSYIGSQTYVGEAQHHTRVTDIGYFYEKDVAHYLESNRVFYDPDVELFLSKSNACCNLLSTNRIREILLRDAASPVYRETIGMATHEQYTFEYYCNYIPDHMERMECAFRTVTELGYRPVFFAEGLMGNTAWDNVPQR